MAAINRWPFGWMEAAFYEFVGQPAARQIVAPGVAGIAGERLVAS